jgi:hypothetical protein
MRCALGFAFAGASHWHRHSADKWARQGRHALPFCPGRADPVRSARLSLEREMRGKVND